MCWFDLDTLYVYGKSTGIDRQTDRWTDRQTDTKVERNDFEFFSYLAQPHTVDPLYYRHLGDRNKCPYCIEVSVLEKYSRLYVDFVLSGTK